MRYRNAGDLLPEALVKDLQRYVQGEYLYIPTDGTQRKGWGERSGARQMLDARNRAIRQAFRQGVSPEVLGEQYHLSPASIRRIYRGCKYSCTGRPDQLDLWQWQR